MTRRSTERSSTSPSVLADEPEPVRDIEPAFASNDGGDAPATPSRALDAPSRRRSRPGGIRITGTIAVPVEIGPWEKALLLPHVLRVLDDIRQERGDE